MAPKIAIIGAGPAGLTLASLLTKSSIPYTIFDLRTRPLPSEVNLPSGSLDLHPESGLLALEACGLLQSFQSLSADCSEVMILADSDGIIHYQDAEDHGGDRPEISRNNLTSILLSSIPEEKVKWECKLRSIERSADRKGWCLYFEDRQAEGVFDLVVGADGAWSKTRSQVTDVKPYFSGINCITLTIPHITTAYPHLGALVGKGTYTASGDKKAIMSQSGSMDSARLYLMISSDSEDWLEDSGIARMDAEAMKETLLADPKLFLGWGHQLKELIAAGCDSEKISNASISAKPLYMISPTTTIKHTHGLTLIGDSAHLMTPFAGEGVNVAMLDAVELSDVITSVSKVEPGDKFEKALDDGIAAFETQMMDRMKPIMEGTYQNLEMIFSEDAPRGFVEFMKSHGPPLEEQ